MAALHFLPPTGHSPSGSSFDSKLISLPPLDEVPVHVPLRRPRPFRFERLRVPVWNPYSRGRLGPAKSEDPKGGEGETDGNPTNFLSTVAAGGTPTRPPRPGEAPHSAPSARNSATPAAQKTALSTPCTHPRGVGILCPYTTPFRSRPRPFRFERLRVPVWNPYSRGRLGPAKSEDPK